MLLLKSLLALLPAVSAVSHIVHEKRGEPLKDAIERRRVDSDTILPMRIGLRHNARSAAKAESWIMDISNPNSPNFGKHWTKREVIDAFAPSEETIRAVREWLAEHDIHHYTHTDNKQWFAFDLRASKAEDLLKTFFFEHMTSRGTFEVSSDEYSLPECLRDHVDFITPGVKPRDVSGRTKRSREYRRNNAPAVPLRVRNEDAPYPASSSSSPPSASSAGPAQPSGGLKQPPYPPNDLTHCDTGVTPACIRALYGIPLADPSVPVSPDNTLGIYESHSLTHQYDLNMFFDYYTDIPVPTYPIYAPIDTDYYLPNQTRGVYHKTYPGREKKYDIGESTLDLDCAFPIVYPQTVTVFQTDDPYNGEQPGFLNTFLDAIDGSYCTYSAFNETGNDPVWDPQYPDPHPLGYKGKLQCGVYEPPNVISISYHIDEIEPYPVYYQQRQCSEWLKLGLQGVTTFVSSGDDGVGPCIGKKQLFNPHFPSNCPWVTSVGATRIPKDGTVSDAEVAVTMRDGFEFGSGGGFSNIFDRPAYQSKAVDTYFKTANLDIPFYYNGDIGDPTGQYNRNGRGYPDIAANGFELANILAKEYVVSYGSSGSTPIVAAIFNRIVEERLRAGKGPIGFINPTLYENAWALNDVVKGGNAVTCDKGFVCNEGWDPVTGLGTPNYPELLKLFMSLP